MILPSTLLLFSLLHSTFAALEQGKAVVASPVEGGDKGDLKGFNYDSADDFKTLFKAVKNTEGLEDFTSAKLFSSIHPSVPPNAKVEDVKPVDAFSAAKAEGFSLLLGIWASAGQEVVDKEIKAIELALTNKEYNKELFPSKIVGIIVGSEDLYRRSKIGTPDEAQLSDKGASPEDVIGYIDDVKKMLANHKDEKSGRPFSELIPVGHADTWGSWQNDTEGGKVIEKCDFVALNAFPYWEQKQVTDFLSWEGALRVTKQATERHQNNGATVPVWSTETGFPYDGPDCGMANPDKANAQIYWQGVGCKNMFGKDAKNKMNSWWFKFTGKGASSGVDKGLNWGVVESVDSATFKTIPAFPLSCDAELPAEVPPTPDAKCEANQVKQAGTKRRRGQAWA